MPLSIRRYPTEQNFGGHNARWHEGGYLAGSWYDLPKEREAAVALMDSGADVLTHFTDTPTVTTAAEAMYSSDEGLQ